MCTSTKTVQCSNANNQPIRTYYVLLFTENIFTNPALIGIDHLQANRKSKADNKGKSVRAWNNTTYTVKCWTRSTDLVHPPLSFLNNTASHIKLMLVHLKVGIRLYKQKMYRHFGTVDIIVVVSITRPKSAIEAHHTILKR